MFAQGFVAEVESLRSHYPLHPDLPAMRCVGYRQVLDVLEQRSPREEMFDRALFATRQLASASDLVAQLPGVEVACDAPGCIGEGAGATTKLVAPVRQGRPGMTGGDLLTFPNACCASRCAVCCRSGCRYRCSLNPWQSPAMRRFAT